MNSPFFKNALVYTLRAKGVDLDNLEEMLNGCAFQPCSSHMKSSSGWVAPFGTLLAFIQGGNALLTMCQEERILPSSVINEAVATKADLLSEQRGHPIGRKERQALKDEITINLLPRAFTRKKYVHLWIDNTNQRVIVGTSSAKEAELILALLRKCIGSLPVVPFTLEHPSKTILTRWVRTGAPSAGFSLLDEAELKASLEEGGVIRCKQQDLVCDEIAHHIDSGKYVTKVGLNWQERVEFLLNEDVSLKRLKFSDSVLEQNNDIAREDEAARFDADFLLFRSEFNEMFRSLVDALGGEVSYG